MGVGKEVGGDRATVLCGRTSELTPFYVSELMQFKVRNSTQKLTRFCRISDILSAFRVNLRHLESIPLFQKRQNSIKGSQHLSFNMKHEARPNLVQCDVVISAR